MWIVAFNAFTLAFMTSIVNRRQVRPGCAGVLKRCVASHAKSSFFIERQVFHIVWMVTSGPVAVFTLHSFVRRASVGPYVIFVALKARLPALILDRKIHPLLNI
jgi:hypothetical protein